VQGSIRQQMRPVIGRRHNEPRDRGDLRNGAGRPGSIARHGDGDLSARIVGGRIGGRRSGVKHTTRIALPNVVVTASVAPGRISIDHHVASSAGINRSPGAGVG